MRVCAASRDGTGPAFTGSRVINVGCLRLISEVAVGQKPCQSYWGSEHSHRPDHHLPPVAAPVLSIRPAVEVLGLLAELFTAGQPVDHVGIGQCRGGHRCDIGKARFDVGAELLEFGSTPARSHPG